MNTHQYFAFLTLFCFVATILTGYSMTGKKHS